MRKKSPFYDLNDKKEENRKKFLKLFSFGFYSKERIRRKNFKADLQGFCKRNLKEC